MPPIGDWRHPFTHQNYRGVPTRLAARLDAIAAQAQHRPGEPHSIESSQHRTRIDDQLQHLLAAFANRAAYGRLIDEIHAGEDGLLPISEDQRTDLRARADTFAELRDLHVAWAVQEGASVEDAALAGAITIDAVLAAISREQDKPEGSAQ